MLRRYGWEGDEGERAGKERPEGVGGFIGGDGVVGRAGEVVV